MWKRKGPPPCLMGVHDSLTYDIGSRPFGFTNTGSSATEPRRVGVVCLKIGRQVFFASTMTETVPSPSCQTIPTEPRISMETYRPSMISYHEQRVTLSS